ncbi:MAG: histidinol dehydrogenase [Pseudomonadota bacterium]
MKKYIWKELSNRERIDILQRPKSQNDGSVERAAAEIIASVREGGDKAVKDFIAKFDGCSLDAFQVTDEEIKSAIESISADNKKAIDTAYATIKKFHEAQGYQNYDLETIEGAVCGRRVVAIENVGLYVPGGTAPLVSTTLMNGIPSQIAGCKNRVLCTPCNKEGVVDAHLIYAASICGITEIYKIGGAQAIAAMAYGTETVPKVDKIFGPGNAYVTAAKKIVAMHVNGAALDMPAGPSEVCVIIDEGSNPAYVAADLLSQAEHDVMSQVLLISISDTVKQTVQQQVEIQLEALPRKDIAAQAIENSIIIEVEDIETAITVSNQYAPEHLILAFDAADELLSKIQNAGSVFVGKWTPESAGDYCSGTNHVLPTNGYAKNYSGLNVEAFQKTITFQTLSESGLGNLSETIQDLAKLEGLDAHANAVAIRMKDLA